MKRRTWLIAASIVVVTPAFMGAISSSELDRPAGTKAMDWVKISDNAGIAIDSDTRTDPLVGRLYIKQGTNWVEVAIQNSPRAIR